MLKSHAKLNLLLNIKAKRADNYHDIEFVNTELELHDEIIIEPNSKGIVIECNNKQIPQDHKNLCHQAATSLGIDNVKITINKNIPVGGLGGGSSNCATVLKALNQEFNLKLTQSELIKKAEDISTDSCFSIIGGTALVRGKGEDVTPLNSIPKFHVLMINPNINIPPNKTQYLYSSLDINNISHPDLSGMLAGIECYDSDIILGFIGNSFESVSIPEYAKVQDLLNQFSHKGFKTIMAGAGPNICCVSKDKKSLEDLQKQLIPNYPTILTETK